jgi:hypothetical protein
LAYSLTLKMKVICSSKTLGFFQTSSCYNPEEHTFPNNCCQNLKSGMRDFLYLSSKMKFSKLLLYLLSKMAFWFGHSLPENAFNQEVPHFLCLQTMWHKWRILRIKYMMILHHILHNCPHANQNMLLNI